MLGDFVMIRYSASYINGDTNFAIQNLQTSYELDYQRDAAICILKNLLQRGNPTVMSKYLQEQLNCTSGVQSSPLYFHSHKAQHWAKTIKGDEEKGYNPAYEFYYDHLPIDMGEKYNFIQNLIIPECSILEITGDKSEVGRSFLNRQVDFYLPQAKLVIEIDGAQHQEGSHQEQDLLRDTYLSEFGVTTLRIATLDLKLKNKAYKNAINKMIQRLDEYQETLFLYKDAVYDFELTDATKAIAVMRWQLTILTMIEAGKVNVSDKIWNFEVKDFENTQALEIALHDLFLWLTHIYKLQKKPFTKPNFEIKYVDDYSIDQGDTIKIDFSLQKRWTDENVYQKEVIFVRNDYFQTTDYFVVSTTDPVVYKIIQEGEDTDIPNLQFIMSNIFGHEEFRDGQLPILINALSGRSTVGLLPTGGGKSLTYQLAVLLQPSISYVVVPIKSLMYDQVENLYSQSINRIELINSDQSAAEKKIIQYNFANGKYLFIFISPERFQIEDFREYLVAVNRNFVIAHAVIDEVHCLSEWGHDFRISYLHLCKTIREYTPTATLLGLSATVSINVLKDIKIEFEIDNTDVKTLIEYKREELTFYIRKINKPSAAEKYENLKQVMQFLTGRLDILNDNNGYKNAGLIFTSTVNGQKGCYGLANQLSRQLKTRIPWYSGSMPKKLDLATDKFDQYKIDVQNAYKKNKYPLMIATKAFGMGVDKQNIRYTVHYSLPGSLESLYQEAGRAGRNKKPAVNFVFYSQDVMSEEDYNTLFQLDTTVEEIESLVKKIPIWEQGDVLGNFFLWIQSNKGVNKETVMTKQVFDQYAVLGSTQTISCSKLGLNFSDTQKAIYRLSVLGIVKDWIIVGFGVYGSFEVTFNDFDVSTPRDALIQYLSKYEASLSLDDVTNENFSNYAKIDQDQTLDEFEKAIRILIQWTYDNIFYNRRQSLKTLLDNCNTNEKDPKQFKETIENYFRFTDSTFIFEHIAQYPDDFEKWFDTLYEDDSEQTVTEATLAEIRAALSRFLENYRYNTGLNFLSGMTRLMADNYTKIDGEERLESAFNTIAKYDDAEKFKVLIETLKLGKFLTDKNKIFLSQILCKHFKDNTITIHNYLQDNHSLDIALGQLNKKLKEVGDKYGKLG